MQSVNWNPLVCFPQAFTVNGFKGMLGIILTGGGIVLYVRIHDKFDGKTYDPRGFKTSKSGAYGTASWMEEKEMKEVLEVAAPAKAEGVILGEYKGNAVCMPKDTRLNRHIAIFGASGTMKSRAIIRNALFQALKRQESVVITDPKGELYSDTAELYRQNGNEVKVFNLVNPEHGDSWNCMSDLNGDTLMAQVLTNVIMGNSGDMSIEVNSTMTVRKTIAVAQVIPQYRQTEGQGRRKLLTPDEVLRLPNEEMLCIIRGCNILKLNKLDYTKHPMSRRMVRTSVMDYHPAVAAPGYTMPVSDESDRQTEPEKEKKPTRRKSLYSSAQPPTEF